MSSGTIAGGFCVLVLVSSLFAPQLAPYEPNTMNIANRFALPSIQHPFGTDDFGRDIFSRIVFGGRTILITGLVSVGVALFIGSSIGVLAGYAQGWLDEGLMRLMDVVLSFPSVLLAILIVAALGPGLSNALIAIAVSMIPVFARLSRSLVVSVAQEEFVTAARALGAKHTRILLHHITPNILLPLIVQASALLAVAISTSTALNFLGLGVEPPTPDWGLMVSSGQRLIFDAPHVPFFPGVVITLTVLAVNFVGDSLRDTLDPKGRASG